MGNIGHRQADRQRELNLFEPTILLISLDKSYGKEIKFFFLLRNLIRWINKTLKHFGGAEMKFI